MRSNFIRLSAAILICLGCFQLADSQDLAARQRQIREAIDRNDLPAALATLGELRQADPKVFALNNYDYLAGRLSQRRGDRAAATTNYLQVARRASDLHGYALWHLAQLARSTGDLVRERENLRQLLANTPGSLLREAATRRLAQSFFESTDYSSAITVLRPLTESRNPSTARQALALTGEALTRSDKRPEATAVFIRLLAEMPDVSRPDDFALAAVRGLDALDVISAKEATLFESDHLTRANVYQFNRDFDAARAHYLAVVEKYPQSSSVADALFQIGRGLYQQMKYGEALKYLQRVESDYPTSAGARDALGLKAATLLRLKRNDEAIAAYKLFIDRYPTAPNPERAYLNIIDALRDARQDAQALEWIRKTRARFKDQIGGTLALFAQAKIHIAQNAWTLAVSDLEELQQAADLGGARIPGGATASEVSFLRGFALEQLGNIQAAIDAYLSVPEGRNEYYGFRADERLKLKQQPRNVLSFRADLIADPAALLERGEVETARRAAQSQLRLEADPAKRKALLEILRQIYARSPAYTLPSFHLLTLGRQEVISKSPAPETAVVTPAGAADELFFLGLYDEAVPELTATRSELSAGNSGSGSAQGISRPDDFAYTIAVYSLRGDLPYPAVRFAESLWRNVPSDYVMELAPREMIELLYPAPYRDALLKETKPRSVDPRFVLSIARQESRFRSDAKSIAAARGLMQFIAATADMVARELKRRGFQQDDLYDPDTAIQFGSQYLQSLFKQFPSQPEAVAASYNGGADNMARWIARSQTNDPARYVPEIGFSQSKDYVFRVMANYWMYQKVYSDQLQTQ